MTYLLLFWEFFKIGLFSVGGGLATLPFLFRLAQTHPEWITVNDISNMIAVSESTPGPMGINMATYTGSIVGGIFGSLCATLGLVAPSIIIILIIARVLEKFSDNRYVKWAFYGLRASVIALISYAGWQVFRISLFDGSHIRLVETALFAVFLVLMLKLKKVHPIVWIGIAAVLGILLKLPS
ncbi:MAG: chromate transporter [Sphaerochaeta sp.]|jgi:chromate transporter|nr:chromate transporter [Sphaerochaeta sp.]MCH3919736.1 chromate transporter [Sphaerochaeta sp.]MCI2045537.1 chromate transporter [Sphaerochaeta sp.]MCI2076221.1 chromate transporter [Sphaerochaeta sp.]MCI2097197.1 chromate transporter [Sphaerochaeta sp.]